MKEKNKDIEKYKKEGQSLSPSDVFKNDINLKDNSGKQIEPFENVIPILQKGHTSSIIFLKISSDEKYIISQSTDKTIKKWEIDSGRLIYTLHDIDSLIISRSEKYIITKSWPDIIKIWEFDIGKLIFSFECLKERITVIALSQDGKYLVTGCYEETIKKWEINSGKLIYSIEYPKEGHICSLIITQDDKYIISGHYNKNIKKIEFETTKLIYSLDSPNQRGVLLTPDEKYIVSISGNKKINIWNFNLGNLFLSQEGFEDYPIAITPDSRYIIFCKFNREKLQHELIKLEIESGKMSISKDGHKLIRQLKISSNGRFIVTCSQLGSIKLWDFDSNSIISSYGDNDEEIIDGPFEKIIDSIEISIDCNWILSGSIDGTIKKWNIDTGKIFFSLDGHKESVFALDISPDGKYIVTGNNDNGIINKWELETGKLIFSLNKNKNRIFAVVISYDGNYIISRSSNDIINKWEMQTGEKIFSFEVKGIRSVILSPDNRYIITASGTIKIWELETGKLLSSFESFRAERITISPDGRYVISYYDYGRTIEKRELKTGILIFTLEGHKDGISAIKITPDSKYIISASIDKTIKIWDFETGKLFLTLEGLTQSVNRMAISSDSKYIISGSWDGALIKWEIETGKIMNIHNNENRYFNSLVISPDNKYIVSGSDSGIKIWSFEKCKLICSITMLNDNDYAVYTPDNQFYISNPDLIQFYKKQYGIDGHKESFLDGSEKYKYNIRFVDGWVIAKRIKEA